MLSFDGVEAVVFLDSEGEAIQCHGALDEDKLQLVGAYQGILLSAVGRVGMDRDRTVITVGDRRSILTRRLKDGYFISVIFQDSHFALVQYQFRELYHQLEREL